MRLAYWGGVEIGSGRLCKSVEIQRNSSEAHLARTQIGMGKCPEIGQGNVWATYCPRECPRGMSGRIPRGMFGGTVGGNVPIPIYICMNSLCVHRAAVTISETLVNTQTDRFDLLYYYLSQLS